MADILPKTIEPNYIPIGMELPKEQTGFGIEDTPATNEKPVEPVNNWDDIDSVNRPEDNATRSQIFAQNSAPTQDFKEGDLWFDSDDNNTIYRANNALAWVSVKDGTIAGKGTTFRQDAVPTALAAGDLWFDSNDSDKQYIATAAGDDEVTAGEWERVDVGANPTLIDSLETTNAPAAAGADVTADNETFSQDSDVDALQTTNAPAEADADVTGDHEAKAVYETHTAGSTFLAGEIGFLGSDGKMYHIDGLTSELDDRITGIALANITAGNSGNFQINGPTTGSGLSAGTKYYAKVPTPTGDATTTADTYNAASGDANNNCGQTFEVATVKPITHIRIRLYLSSAITITSLGLEIYAESSGIPTGSALATATGYTPTITTSAQWVDFYFATPFVPEVSTTYCFVTTGILAAAGFLRCIRSSTGYADGTALDKIGGAWRIKADDLSFGIYQGTGEIATTGSDKLIGIAKSTTVLSLKI